MNGDFLILNERDEGGTVCYDVRVPLDSDYFAGHFEGRPILPAIAQLALIERLLCEKAGRQAVSIDDLSHLRFQQPLFPDDRFEVRLRTAGDGERRSFAIQRQTRRISRGEFGVNAGVAENKSVPDGIEIDVARGIDTGLLLPHRSPARWIDGVGQTTEKSIRVSGRIPSDSAFVSEGQASSYVALEFAAQAAAVLETLGRASSGGDAAAHLGYLVGARQVQLDAPRVAAAAEVLAEVELEGTAGPLSIYRSRVVQAGQRIAAATVSTYITDEVAG